LKSEVEDDAVDSKGEYDSILRSALKSPGMEIDGIDSWSDIEIVESRFLSPDAVVTEIVTPLLLFM